MTSGPDGAAVTARSALPKLARHSLVYGIGSAIGVAGSLLLIPLYTHALSTAEYGALELLYRTCEILMIVMFMGVRQAYIRFYFEKRGDDEWHSTVTGTTVIFVLLSCAAILLLFLPFRGLVLDGLLKGSVSDLVFLLVLAWIPFEMLVNVGLTFLQIRMRSIAYVVTNLLRLVLFVGINLWLVYVLHYGITGVFLAQVGVTGGIAAAFLAYLVVGRHLRFSLPLIKEMVKYGLPYLPASLFMYVVINSDRYFLGIYGTLDDVGIYSLAARVGMIGIMFLADPFLKVWSPFLFENHQKPDGPATLSRVFTLFTLVSVTTALGVSVLAPVLLPLITGDDFHVAYGLVPVICLAAVFYSMSHLVDAGILISKKTHYKPMIFGIAAAVALAANVTLTRSFGTWGAAAALVLALFTLLVVNHRIANRFYRLPVELRRLLLIFAAAGVTYLLSLYLLKRNDGSLLGEVVSVLAMACFPLLLWVAGFFTHGERELLHRLFRIGRSKAEVVP